MSKDPFADIVNAPDDQFGAFADIVQPQDHRTMPPGRAQDYQNTQPQLMTNAKVSGQKLPVVWNATVDGVPVQAALDTQAGAYLFNDASGKPNMLIRKPDGSLGARPYQYPGTNPIEGMTTGQIMAAGAGKSAADTWRGVGQLFSVGQGDKQAAEELAIREQDKPLMDTGAGKVGYVGGALATMVTPGVLLKGAGAGMQAANLARAAQAVDAAGNAILIPKTLKGAAALGAAQGAVQPAANTQERVINTALGGAAGAVVPAAVSATGSAIAKYAPTVANAGRIAAGAAQTAPRAALERIGISSPATALSAPAAAHQGSFVSQPEAEKLAKDASQKLGFNWGSLDESVRNRMTAQVQDAVNLDTGITPEGIAKKIMLENHGFQTTRALLTGNPQDFAVENSARMFPEGQVLNAIDVANNANLRAQIQKAAPTTPTTTPEFGASLRKELGKESAVSEGRVKSLYEVAAKNEGDITTDATPLIKALSDKQAFAVTKEDSPVLQFLRRIGKEQMFFPTANTVAAKNQPKELTMSELSTLRQIVNSKWENADNATQASLNKLRGILNTMEANPNAPAPLYQKARVSRIIQGKKWESPELRDIFAEDPTFKGRMQVADENLFNHVFLRPTTDKTASVWARMNASQKDAARAQLAQHIENETFSGQGLTSGIQRDVVATPSKFIRALDKIGPEKLRLIMGQAQADRLQSLAKAWRDISTSPAGTKAAGSAPELAQMQQRMLKAISDMKTSLPVVGPYIGAVEKLTGKAEKDAYKAQLIKDAQDKAAREANVSAALSPIESAKAQRMAAIEEERRLAAEKARRAGALALPAVAGQSAFSR